MTASAIVVGGGIMGLSTARALVQRGLAVTLYEQHDIPNERGASVDQHRLIRHAYGTKRGYARMVDAAFAAWDRLWRDLGRSHFTPTGTLCIAAPGGDWVNASRTTLEEIGVATEPLDADAIAARWPFIETAGIDSAFHCATGGFLAAREIVAALADWLNMHGAAVMTNAPVADVDPETAQVRLADGTRAQADLVVIAAGPWITRLYPGLARRLTPSRQVAAYLNPPAGHAEAWAAAPMVLDIGAESGFYMVPPRDGYGMKLGDHTFSLTGDPDGDREVSAAERAALLAQAAHRLKDFGDYEVAELRTCFYTVEPEEKFILAPAGARGWLMTGFSGHGFKFGALLGEAMAATLMGERDAAQLGLWAAGGEPDRTG